MTNVTRVGTTSPQRSATASVTGAFGQTPTAGNLLLAVCTVVSSTAASLVPTSVTAGWNPVAPQGYNNVAQATGSATITFRSGVYLFTKVATGSDTALSVTFTASGTIATTCTIIELNGANTTTWPFDPVAIAGYASGSASSTVSFSATAGATLSAGGYGLSVFVQERAAATVTWSETGTGWTSLYSDGATSSVGHTQINEQAGIGSGTALSDSGSFSTATTAYGAALVVTINTAPSTAQVVQYMRLMQAAATSISVTFQQATQAGNTLIAVNTCNSSAATRVTSLTLSPLGTADNFARDTISGTHNGNAFTDEFWEDHNCASGQTSITAQLAVSAVDLLEVYEVYGLISTGAFDLGIGATAASGATWSSGASATLSQAAEFAVATAATGFGGLTVSATGWVANSTETSGNTNITTAYQWTPSTAALTYNGAISSPNQTSLASLATYKVAPPAAGVAVAAPVQQIPQRRRQPARAGTGPRGLCAAGIAVAALASVQGVAVPAPHQPPPIARPVPARAHLGPAGRNAAGVSGQAHGVYVPRQPPRTGRPLPSRGKTGPSGLPGAGHAGSPNPPAGILLRMPPRAPQRKPQRAVWRGIAGAAPVVYVAVPAPKQVTQPRRPPGARAVVRGAAGTVGSYTYVAVPAPAWHPQPRPRAGARGLWRGLSGPQPRPVPQPRVLPQIRHPQPQRAIWRGFSAAPPRPGPPPQRFLPPHVVKPQRALWRGGRGQPAAVAGVAVPAPKLLRQPPRRVQVARAIWRRITGTIGPVTDHRACAHISSEQTAAAAVTSTTPHAAVTSEHTAAAAATSELSGTAAVSRTTATATVTSSGCQL